MIIFTLLIFILGLMIFQSFNKQEKNYNLTQDELELKQKVLKMGGDDELFQTALKDYRSQKNYLKEIQEFISKNSNNINILHDYEVLDKEKNFILGNECYKNVATDSCNDENKFKNESYEMGLSPVYYKFYKDGNKIYYIYGEDNYQEVLKIKYKYNIK